MTENEHQYGTAKREYPAEVVPESRLKREVKQGRAVDGTSEPETTSTQTPDPNVETIGDTLTATDTDAASTTTVTETGGTKTTSGATPRTTGTRSTSRSTGTTPKQ